MNTPNNTQYIKSPETPQRETTVWVLSKHFKAYFYNSGYWFEVISPSTSPVVAISGCPDGSVIVTDNNENAYHTCLLTQISLYSSLQLVENNTKREDFETTTTTDGKKFSYCEIEQALLYDGGPTTQQSTLPRGATIIEMNEVAHILIFDSFYCGWIIAPGIIMKQADVSLSINNNNNVFATQICGVDASGDAWMYDNKSATWAAISKPTPSAKFEWIESNNGHIWALLTSGDMFHGRVF